MSIVPDHRFLHDPYFSQLQILKIVFPILKGWEPFIKKRPVGVGGFTNRQEGKGADERVVGTESSDERFGKNFLVGHPCLHSLIPAGDQYTLPMPLQVSHLFLHFVRKPFIIVVQKCENFAPGLPNSDIPRRCRPASLFQAYNPGTFILQFSGQHYALFGAVIDNDYFRRLAILSIYRPKRIT
jgi:hypothetical protein